MLSDAHSPLSRIFHFSLFVVSTKVGGVPEVLPNYMINYAMPEEDGKEWIQASNRNNTFELLTENQCRSCYCHIKGNPHDTL